MARDLKAGAFYWVRPVWDVDLVPPGFEEREYDEDMHAEMNAHWSQNEQPALFHGYGSDGEEHWLYVGMDWDDGWWPVSWVGERIEETKQGARLISEDRIKRLVSSVDVKLLETCDALAKEREFAAAERILIEGMGRAFAEKLVQLDKVLMVCNADGRLLEVRAEIVVIVPDAPPGAA